MWTTFNLNSSHAKPKRWIVFVCACVPLYAHLLMCVCAMCVCVCVYVRACVRVCECVCVCMHACTYVHRCVCVFVFYVWEGLNMQMIGLYAHQERSILPCATWISGLLPLACFQSTHRLNKINKIQKQPITHKYSHDPHHHHCKSMILINTSVIDRLVISNFF